ncbi:MAG: hypothetical protein DMF68_00115 [Acidobacteria bacterium]|nr:MAG: hypothetical protein DMF68_00115 [Acidobacteriota bacterium]
MSLTEHEIDIRTGRRDGDGHIHVSIFAGEMVALILEGHGERAPTMLLTLEQARRLQRALTELIPLVEESQRQEEIRADEWRGEERRLAS